MEPDILLKEFLETKEGDVPLTPNEFKEMRELFVSSDVFVQTQKSYADALTRSAETDQQLRETLIAVCGKQNDQEVRLVDLERGHEHDEECHQLTEAKVDRKIRVAVMAIGVIALVTTILVTVIVPAAKAIIIPLINK